MIASCSSYFVIRHLTFRSPCTVRLTKTVLVVQRALAHAFNTLQCYRILREALGCYDFTRDGLQLDGAFGLP